MKAGLLLISCVVLSGMLGFSDRLGSDSPDKAFVMKAADGGMLEVKLGELANRKATSPKMKEFAQMMIKDHTKVNEELKGLAARRQLTIPAQLTPAKQQMYDSLAATSGSKFDMLYMNMMIASHEETVGVFQVEASSGQDAELKKWADGKIPALKHHLEMSKTLFEEGTKTNGN